jgi:hypothetical protein
VCSRHCIALHHSACREGYKQGGRGGRASRSGLIEARCQYLGEGGERVSVLPVVPFAAGGLPPPFIGQGDAVYNRAAQFQLRVAVWCIAPWSRRQSWLILLLAEHRGVPCIRPRAASRVVVWELLPWSSCMRRFDGQADGRLAVAQRPVWWRLVVPYSHNAGDGAVVPWMAAW